MPDWLASIGDDIWATDGWAPAIVRTNLEGELLDWGEKPFDWPPIAWDGDNLWAIDREHKRICIIEKTESGREITRAVAATRERGT